MQKIIMEKWWLGYNLTLRIYLEGSGEPKDEHVIIGVSLLRAGTMIRGIGKITPEYTDITLETEDLTRWTQSPHEWEGR